MYIFTDGRYRLKYYTYTLNKGTTPVRESPFNNEKTLDYLRERERETERDVKGLICVLVDLSLKFVNIE